MFLGQALDSEVRAQMNKEQNLPRIYATELLRVSS
jgi:hypothetical protein